MGASILVSDTIHQKNQEIYCHAGWEDELSKALSVRGRFKWQPNFKSGSLRTCVEVDFAVMPFDDDPVADNEPKATLANNFSRNSETRRLGCLCSK